MSQIVKTFTALMMMLFLMLTTTSMLGLMVDTVTAQNMHSSMIEELENSHYAKAVIEDCFNAARANGYQLEMILYSTEQGRISCNDIANIPQQMTGVYTAEVVLAYELNSPFFYLQLNQTIAGYAR